MAQESFLKFPLSSIRRSIKDIDDSYRNPWDILRNWHKIPWMLSLECKEIAMKWGK